MQPTQAYLFNLQHGLTPLQAEQAQRIRQALASIDLNAKRRAWRKSNPLMGAPGYGYANGFGHGYRLALVHLMRAQTLG